MLPSIQRGLLPPELADLLSPFAADIHEAHIQSLGEAGQYQVGDLSIQVAPGLYHPHASSSSLFTLRTLLREKQALGKLLELGCGTGVLSLSLLNHGLVEQSVMVDISETAVETSHLNAEQAGLAARTRIVQGDMFAPVAGETFDTVLFNMPLMHRTHSASTHRALDDTGGRLAQRFFNEVGQYLKPGGSAYFAYSNISGPALLAEFRQRHPVALVAAEWVASSGFWLMVYRTQLPTGD
jgi:release factor glutamine methyltransferase